MDLVSQHFEKEIQEEIAQPGVFEDLAKQDDEAGKVPVGDHEDDDANHDEKVIKNTVIDGKWKPGITINGSTVTLGNGETANLERIDAKKIKMKLDGTAYFGELLEDGTLHWSDGNVWTKDTAAESADKHEIVEEDLDEQKTRTESSDGDNSDSLLGEVATTSPQPTVPPGCRVLCVGRAPFCGGNSKDCTDRGMVTVGYTKRCLGSWWTCLSGWKVRCAKATATCTVTAATRPASMPIVAQWIAPLFERRRRSTPPTLVDTSALNMPWKQYATYGYAYDTGAMGNATAQFQSAYANVTQFKANVSNMTQLVRAIERNISLFSQASKKLEWEAARNRRGAVNYAEKRVQANITAMRAVRTRDDALFAEKAATNEALNASMFAVNARAHKVYYKKALIDKKNTLRKAEHALKIAQKAVNNAVSWYHEAQQLDARHRMREQGKMQRVRALERYKAKISRWLAVKCAMEHADFIASGGTRGISAACAENVETT